MNPELQYRLSLWKNKADQVTQDHWVRFIMYWMIFDAYMTELSGLDGAHARLVWFYQYNTELKAILESFWMQPAYQSVIEQLKNYGDVRDMSPSHPRPPVSITDPKNTGEVMEVIYRIRCNTFHGAKNLADRWDQHLVRLSQYLFDEPLNSLLGLDESRFQTPIGLRFSVAEFLRRVAERISPANG